MDHLWLYVRRVLQSTIWLPRTRVDSGHFLAYEMRCTKGCAVQHQSLDQSRPSFLSDAPAPVPRVSPTHVHAAVVHIIISSFIFSHHPHLITIAIALAYTITTMDLCFFLLPRLLLLLFLHFILFCPLLNLCESVSAALLFPS